MDTIIISEKQAKYYKMSPVTAAGDYDSDFIQAVVRDMQRVPGTVWAVVKPASPAFAKSPNMVEIWRAPIPMPE